MRYPGRRLESVWHKEVIVQQMIQVEDLSAISDILQRDLDETETYGLIRKLLERMVPFDAATLFYYSETKDCMEMGITWGDYVVELAEESSFMPGINFSSWIVRQKEPLIISSLSKTRSGSVERSFKSFLSLPLRSGKRLIGSFNFGHREPGRYSTEEMETYQILAVQMSLVAEKLALKREALAGEARLTKMDRHLKALRQRLKTEKKAVAIKDAFDKSQIKMEETLISIISHTQMLPLLIEVGNRKKLKENIQKVQKAVLQIKKLYREVAQYLEQEQ